MVNQIILDYKGKLINEIKLQKDDINVKIGEMKRTFESNIGKKFDEVTERYKKALDEKESKLKALAEGIEGLTEIEQIFNK